MHGAGPEIAPALNGHIALHFNDSYASQSELFAVRYPAHLYPYLRFNGHLAMFTVILRVVRYSLLVRLLHPLLHAGLSRRTVNHSFRRQAPGGGLIVAHQEHPRCELMCLLGDRLNTKFPSQIGMSQKTGGPVMNTAGSVRGRSCLTAVIFLHLPSPSRLNTFPTEVSDNLDIRNCDQPFFNHGIKMRNQLLDLIFRVDNAQHNGSIA